MTDERQPLSSRRKNQSMELVFDGIRFHLTVGFYDNGRIGEVWLNGPRPDSALYHITQDACVLISHLLQRFASPHALFDSMPRKADGAPASVIGAIIELLASLPEPEEA
jgi:hypothetical protein